MRGIDLDPLQAAISGLGTPPEAIEGYRATKRNHGRERLQFPGMPDLPFGLLMPALTIQKKRVEIRRNPIGRVQLGCTLKFLFGGDPLPAKKRAN